MTVHRDFFPENDSVREYVTSLAAIIYGDGWNDKDSNVFSVPRKRCLGQWEGGDGVKHLEIVTNQYRGLGIFCKKNFALQDPRDGIPAVTEFREDGTMKRQEHFQNSRPTNPPNGAPQKIEYNSRGKFAKGWYVDNAGVPTVMVDAKTVATRRKSALGALCNNAISGDIVALSGRGGLQGTAGIFPLASHSKKKQR